MPRVVVALLVGLTLPALAEEPAWQTVATGAITVKARPRLNSAVREIYAEGDLDAPVEDLQGALSEMARFPHFMPYVKSARRVSEEPDGSSFNYTELALPVISDRDYIVHTWVDEGVQPDGSGTFRCHWEAAAEKLPERKNLVRLKLVEGSWVITPNADGKSHFIYRFVADPGGMLPAFIANYGNQHGVTDTISAIEKEARRRQKERLSAPAANSAGPARQPLPAVPQ